MGQRWFQLPCGSSRGRFWFERHVTRAAVSHPSRKSAEGGDHGFKFVNCLTGSVTVWKCCPQSPHLCCRVDGKDLSRPDRMQTPPTSSSTPPHPQKSAY